VGVVIADEGEWHVLSVIRIMFIRKAGVSSKEVDVVTAIRCLLSGRFAGSGRDHSINTKLFPHGSITHSSNTFCWHVQACPASRIRI
jgi:hypothetical protein